MPLLPLERLLADLDLVALARACRSEHGLELLALGRVADDPEAAVGAIDPVRAARRRLRAVLEELRQLGRVLGARLRRGRAEPEERELELVDPRAGRAGDREDADDPLVLDREAGRLGQQVDLVQHDRLRPLVEAGAVERELAVDRAEALLDVLLGRVDHVQEQPRALEVGEELVPEADPLARALDQTRGRPRR